MSEVFKGARTGEPLERRIARLEDIEAIKNLKAQYALYCDNGYDADGVVSLFTEDATWESNAFGSYEGKQAIHDFLTGLADESIKWALHYVISPVVEVAEDGSSAHGRWYLLELGTLVGLDDPSTRDPVIMTANYEDDFVKTDGAWKFTRVNARFHQVSNLADGWVKQPFRGSEGPAPGGSG
ncbi:MAG: nuclear transport factor 2 family protein [Nocardioidaceae bacterium]